jgi:hypothetical protein
MRARLETQVDCTAGNVLVGVDAELIDDGDSELDLALYEAMTQACRLLAEAVRRDQRTQVKEVAAR